MRGHPRMYDQPKKSHIYIDPNETFKPKINVISAALVLNKPSVFDY